MNQNNSLLITKHNNKGMRSNICSNEIDVLDISYIRQQIRSIFLIDSVRVNSRGK